MTLEQYLRHELANGAIDFTFRATSFNGGPVEIYIHPLNRDGRTTPTLLVEGDTVREKRHVWLMPPSPLDPSVLLR